MHEITNLLNAIEKRPSAAEELLPLVYNELKKLAAAKLAREKPGQTIQATALVHEAWLRVAGTNDDAHWNSRGHFFGAAALAMQRILVENARRKKSIRGGGELARVELNDVATKSNRQTVDILAMDEALAKLASKHPRKAELVRLRFFAGLTLAEAAQTLKISSSTADNDWAYAKAWLRLELDGSDGPAER